MSDCIECKRLAKEIADLNGVVDFHKGESKSWRTLFNEQRGGAAFDTIQKAYADLVVENRRQMSNYIEHVHDISIKHDAEIKELQDEIERLKGDAI